MLQRKSTEDSDGQGDPMCWGGEETHLWASLMRVMEQLKMLKMQPTGDMCERADRKKQAPWENASVDTKEKWHQPMQELLMLPYKEDSVSA